MCQELCIDINPLNLLTLQNGLSAHPLQLRNRGLGDSFSAQSYPTNKGWRQDLKSDPEPCTLPTLIYPYCLSLMILIHNV